MPPSFSFSGLSSTTSAESASSDEGFLGSTLLSILSAVGDCAPSDFSTSGIFGGYTGSAAFPGMIGDEIVMKQ